jgi:hypothetical protein
MYGVSDEGKYCTENEERNEREEVGGGVCMWLFSS